jgi:putative transposase
MVSETRPMVLAKGHTHGGPRPVCTAGGPGRTEGCGVDDRIRQAAQTIYQALIEAELTAVIGAAPHERTRERLTQRNGHRPPPLTTSAGDLELRIPKLRAGSFFPSLLERRRRVDQALFAVSWRPICMGVSTRKVDDLVRALGG